MPHPNLIGILVALTALVAGCASSERSSLAKRDLFGDPSKFESLASSPLAAPAPEVAPTETLQRVADTVERAPVPAPSLLDGASLVSPAVAFHPDLDASPNRSPAGVRKEEEIPSPESAYTDLIRGNERFVAGLIAAPRRDGKRRREIASREKPFAVVLSCSDSRTPPELVFDQGLGDLVSIRVPGNVLGSAQVASIEDAVENLGVRLIVVLGHDSCGAVKAALEAPRARKLASEGSPDLDWLVTSIRPNLKQRGVASVTPVEDPRLRKPAIANVDAVTENLLVRSRIISDAVAKGKLKVVRGIHALETGRVDFWGMK